MKIEVKWGSPFRGPEEIRRTSGTMRILFGSWNAARLDDSWSESVHEEAHVSAYPLALWLASSWWRLRWEPKPFLVSLAPEHSPAVPNWRMNHELPAAGYGFLWPLLTFSSDGQVISVTCRPSHTGSKEPVRYLSEFDTFVPAADFEKEVDRFLDLVLRRLDNIGETELHALWREVLAERADPVQSSARRIEARLGYDPDDAPESLVEDLLRLSAEAGEGAADEIAPVCAGSNPATALEQIRSLALQVGILGKVAVPQPEIGPLGDGDAPWRQAYRLANSVRQELGLGIGPLDDRSLSELLQIPASSLTGAALPPPRAPIGLAIRNGDGKHLNLLFRKRNRPGRRFEASRFIAEALCADPKDRWLPVTDAATSRQKLQRAFAIEFLCPLEALKAYLGNELFPEAFEDAAEHFGISEMAVKSHLANHGLIPRELAEFPRSL